MNVPREIGRQLNFIISSCQLYDKGRYDEACRIALAARVLFHNTAKSKGIIGGHQISDDLKLLSTTMFKPGFPASKSHFLGFIGLLPTSGFFRPYLDDAPRKENIPWKVWWEQEPIMSLANGQEYITRNQLILACANKDGGAHVDEVKPKEYERLEDGLGFEVLCRFRGKTGNQKVKLRYANFAAIRQIGYEILLSEELTTIAKESNNELDKKPQK